MASPATLQRFRFIHCHCLSCENITHLSISDHGIGWKSAAAKVTFSLLQDWTSNGEAPIATPNHLIAGALRDADGSHTGNRLDLLGIDACITVHTEQSTSSRTPGSGHGRITGELTQGDWEWITRLSSAA